MFHGVPKSVVLASLLGLIPILMGLASTFNIGLTESFKEDFIRFVLVYSGFILSFMSGCIFFVSRKPSQMIKRMKAGIDRMV